MNLDITFRAPGAQPTTASLTDAQGWALAQFLKRVSYDTAMSHAVDHAEAYLILDATDRLRRALAELGLAPR